MSHRIRSRRGIELIDTWPRRHFGAKEVPNGYPKSDSKASSTALHLEANKRGVAKELRQRAQPQRFSISEAFSPVAATNR